MLWIWDIRWNKGFSFFYEGYIMGKRSDDSSLASNILMTILITLVLGAILYTYFSKDFSVAFIVLGIYMFIMFVVFLIERAKKKPGSPNLLSVITALLLGCILTSLGLLLIFSYEFKEWFRSGWLILLSIVSLAAGIIIICASIAKYLKRKKHCNCTVDAVCVDIKGTYDIQNQTKYYTPVWEFELNGEKKRAINNFYPAGKVTVGTHVTLHVDPDNVNNHYQNRLFDGGCIALLCAGGTFIVLSFIGIIVYFILKATGVF